MSALHFAANRYFRESTWLQHGDHSSYSGRQQRRCVRPLETFLTFNPKIRVVGEATDGKEALEKVLDLRPDLVLMDIDIGVGGKSGRALGHAGNQTSSIRKPGSLFNPFRTNPTTCARPCPQGHHKLSAQAFSTPTNSSKPVETVAEREASQVAERDLPVTRRRHRRPKQARRHV